MIEIENDLRKFEILAWKIVSYLDFRASDLQSQCIKIL